MRGTTTSDDDYNGIVMSIQRINCSPGSGMLFMPDISMIKYGIDNRLTHRRFFIECRNVGQRKAAVRPFQVRILVLQEVLSHRGISYRWFMGFFTSSY